MDDCSCPHKCEDCGCEVVETIEVTEEELQSIIESLKHGETN